MSSARKGSNRRKSVAGVPPSKRLKQIDRISELPDALIVHILSFLRTRDKIRTGALARKWRYLWTRSPILKLKGFNENKLDCETFHSDDYLHDFVEYANKTLSLCNDTKIKEFRIQCMYDDIYESHFNRWTRFAARMGTEKFKLYICPIGSYKSFTLPQCLYTHSSFIKLSFCYCDVSPKGPVSWKSLKKLTISEAKLSDDAFQKILAGCPALEIMDLQDLFKGVYKLHFGDSGLKELTLNIEEYSPDFQEVAELEISAPNLQSLEVSGYFSTCKLFNMTSLVEATLFGQQKHNVAGYPILTQGDLSSLSMVQALTIGNWVMEGIAMLREKGVHHSLSKCKWLTIDTHILQTDPKAIASMLKSSPGIETLTVTDLSDNDCEWVEDIPSRHASDIDQYWASQKADSSYLMHLRTVNFVGFWAYRTHVFSFVRFLLKNAKNLQKMIIHLEKKGSESVVPEQLFETSQKLLSFPRSSPDAELLVYK